MHARGHRGELISFSHLSSLTRGAAAGNRAVFRSGLGIAGVQWRHRAERALCCNGEAAVADDLFARRQSAEAIRLTIGKESVRC